MTNIQSKLVPITTSCIEYVHPWTDSCWNSTAGLLIHASQHSLRIYSAVYLLSLMMRGRVPTKRDIKRTIQGIIQSSAFLTTNSFSYVMFVCMLRNMIGNFHFITVAYIPAFLASLAAILVERPTRRILLALYVSNVATETLWRMAVSRNLVKSIPYGQAIIFGCSSSLLLYFYRLGLHNTYRDSLFDIFRFVIGRDEEGRVPLPPNADDDPPIVQNVENNRNPNRSRNRNHFRDISFLVRIYTQLLDKIKKQPKHKTCPHNNSCMYYSIRGGCKLFMVGFGLQVTLKIALQLKKVIQLRLSLRKTIFNRNTLKLGIFLGGFSFLFRSISCSLRHITGVDHPLHAIPAGLIASCAFTQYPDVTVALYVMWKMLQISYNIGIEKGVVPKVPGFTILLYCAATALLFHAATFEPLNLRPSYWKFLHSISGGRVGVMARTPLDVWGLNSHRATQEVMKLTQTIDRPLRYAFR